MLFKKIILNSSNILLFLSILFLQCKNSQVPNTIADQTLAFSVEANECYGECPVYIFQLFSDGSLQYEGKKHVERLGSYSGVIGDAQNEKLFQLLDVMNFYEMKIKNDPKLSDGSSMHFYAKKNERENKVLYHLPKRQAMENLKELVLSIIDESEWKSDN